VVSFLLGELWVVRSNPARVEAGSFFDEKKEIIS
jgi:hypothetical protein